MIKKTDYLVIGSGVAGLTFALKAAEYGLVSILAKGEPNDGNSDLAQGGIASVFGKDDSFDLHIDDTLKAGAGLCVEEVVDICVKSGPKAINELFSLGVNFNQENHEFKLAREGGHSRRRIVYDHDTTGHSVHKTLLKKVLQNKNITFYTHHQAIDLIINSDNFNQIASGVIAVDLKKSLKCAFLAKVIAIATGGCGQVFENTTNPEGATGDGLSMALKANLNISNMEFIQFHPTCLYHPKVKGFLISEAVRGEGARLINAHGQTIMDKHPLKDLACRDIVARAIAKEMELTGDKCVYLDISHQSRNFLENRFPKIYNTCLKLGIDIAKEPIPVAPAAHYQCGGINVTSDGKTSINNLYALGEVASTGLHGANRLASNSLLEALVIADRAVLASIDNLKMTEPVITNLNLDYGTNIFDNEKLIDEHKNSIKSIMWKYVGIIRTDSGLHKALKSLTELKNDLLLLSENQYQLTKKIIELNSLLDTACLITNSALSRRESRGAHFNCDWPCAANF